MNKHIVIFATETLDKTETFIKAHVDRLNGSITYLNGKFFPAQSEDAAYQLREYPLLKKIFKKFDQYRLYQRLFLNPQLISYLKKSKPEVALAEYGTVGAHVYQVCKYLRLPLIVHFHGYDAHNHKTLNRYGTDYSLMFRYASAIIAVSQDMRKQLIAVGADPHKVVVNPYGPNTDFFNIDSDFEALNYVCVGRFVEKKAPDKTIEAFHKLLSVYPDATLSMAGDGPLLEKCKQLVKDYQIERSVNFLGAVSHKEVVKLYKKAYCFVQHSVVAPSGDSEGTPVAILEANAAGLPVVSTRHMGIKEVINHEETGYLVDEFDVEGMAKYMIKLAADRELAKEIGANGRARIAREYTMEKHISTLDNLIKNASC